MLDSAQRERVKSMRDYKAKHSTLLEACSNNGNHQNSQETSNNGNGSGHSDDYGDSFWVRDQESNDDTNKIHALLAMNMESS